MSSQCLAIADSDYRFFYRSSRGRGWDLSRDACPSESFDFFDFFPTELDLFFEHKFISLKLSSTV